MEESPWKKSLYQSFTLNQSGNRLDKLDCKDPGLIPATAKKIIDFCKDVPVWVFKGNMGAGKTTFIKEIARQMGVEDRVSSPTYAIIHEYQDAGGRPFYHFDFYRLEDPEEALELGLEEYFYSGNYCWIEWPEKISAYIPEKFAMIEIEEGTEGNREIALNIVNDGRSEDH